MRRREVISISLVAALAAAPASGLAAGASKSSNVPIDWNVSLRGKYTVDGTGGHYESLIAPELTLSLGDADGGSSFAAGGEVAVDQAGTTSIDELHASAQSQNAWDEYTSLNQSLDLQLTKLDADSPDLPANTATGPLEFTGKAQAGFRREFEPFYVSGSADLNRFIEGPTTLDDSSTVDNTSRSYWGADASLRLGFEINPLVSLFVDGSQSYQKYDAPDPTVSAYLDGGVTALRAGVAITNDDYFSAEASLGEAWHDYVNGALADRGAFIYDASVSFTPDDTLALGASVDSALVPSELVPGDTDLTTTVGANAAVQVGEGVKLRGTASWNQATTLGTGQISTGYSVGTGIDYSPSPQTVWSADYLVTHNFQPPGPATDTQSVTLGLKILN